MIDDGLREFMELVGTRTKPIYYVQFERRNIPGSGLVQWDSTQIYILRQEPKGAYLMEERKNRSPSSWESILNTIARSQKQGAADFAPHPFSEDTRDAGYLECDGDRYFIIPNNYVDIPDDAPDPPAGRSDACDGGG